MDATPSSPEFAEVFDPFSLVRPPSVTETRTFTDPLQPGHKLTLTFTAQADYGVPLKVKRLALRLLADYGDASTGASLVPVDDRPIDPEPGLLYYIAAMQVLQVPAAGQKPYNEQQWAALSVTMPNAFAEIAQWTDDLSDRASGAGDDSPPV